MDQALLYRRMAVKWLESAEHVEHRALKRCYQKRAQAYEALAAAARRRDASTSLSSDGNVLPPGVTRH